MIFPNKVTNFDECVLGKTPIILEKLLICSLDVNSLYKKCEYDFSDIDEFILSLDVLYALGSIKFDSDKKVITYVERNIL